jgi:hypothetical protein
MPEKRALEILAVILKDNLAMYHHDGKSELHPTEPILNKYHYVTSRGCERRKEFKKKEEVSVTKEGAKAFAEGVRAVIGSPTRAALTLGVSTEGMKQEEGEGRPVDWDTSCSNLKSCAKGVEKLVTGMQDTYAQLVTTGKKDTACATKAEEFLPLVKKMEDFLKTIRLIVAEIWICDKEDSLKFQEQMSAMTKTGEHHIGGAKLAIKKYKAFLTGCQSRVS